MDKIYKTLFDAKRTVKGPRLRLSLAYDIVSEGHGGELKVQTKEGKGTAFIILLSTNNN